MITDITNVFGFAIPITDVKTFGDRLRYARDLRQLTQKELARACGLSQGAIGNYETDSRRNPKNVFRLAEALKVEPAWLAMGTGPMEISEAPVVAEMMSSSAGKLWPLPGVEPVRIWALPAQKRELLAQAVSNMLTLLEEE